ncbi:uncharacterized protein LOC106164536 [Lingula anatina]|uniref:Uncharacterized protein LOC106164536 n=1 Tax=Lingula anatina TaxID=7574 RepID=A0A1S3IK88_LINAN|nr:uncharacterized protein LOC106164536 [Lingula anatina]XP_013397935.1 uncharacterized protein LOC106164536 [Lingula anatina]|eukprot:XP_013397934.1 uncharacterized protein LOC106164536 [Lingula anatina]
MRNSETDKLRTETRTPHTARSASSFSGSRQSASSGEQQSARLRTHSGSPVKTDIQHDLSDRRLSAPELPPIMGGPKSPTPGYVNGGTPLSTPRSSDGTSPVPLFNGNNGGAVSYPVIKRKHKPERISLNSPVDVQLRTSKSPMLVDSNTSPESTTNGVRHPQLSPGSMSSGYDSPRSALPPTPKSPGHRQLPLSTELRLARTKSWCPGNDNGGLASPKLETLFEKQLLSSQNEISKSGNNVKVRLPRSGAKPPIPGMRRNYTQTDLKGTTRSDLKGMSRTQSEPFISDMNKNRKLKISQSAKKSDNKKTNHVKVKTNGKANPTHSNSSKSSSLSQERLYMRDVLSRQPSSKADDSAQGDSAGEDGEQDERIIQWLLGVESAEHPPEPVIIDEEPSQTDTAIHIVYQGD